MEEVTMYMTKDGKVFQSKHDAELHEEEMELIDEYEDNKIYEGCKIELDDFVDWLKEHAGMVRRMMRVLKV